MESLRDKTYRILRWSEGFSKMDMIYVAKGGFWLTFGQATTTLLSFALLFGFANLLPRETYGLYRYILSLSSTLTIFTLTGMNQAVARAVATGEEGVLRTSVKYQLKWNGLMFIAALGVSIYYLNHGNTTLAVGIMIAGIFYPLTAALGTYGPYLDGKRLFRLNNIYSVISTAIYVVGMLITLLLTKEVLWFIVVYSVTTFLSSLLFYILTIRKFHPPVDPSIDTLKYGRQLTYIGILDPLVTQIDSIVLNHFWGPAQLAVYSLATAIPNRVSIYIKGWVNVGFPKLANRTVEEIERVFYKRIALGILSGGAVALIYIFLSPYMFKYLLPKYLDGLFYSQLLSIGLIFSIPNRFVSLLFSAQKLPKLILFNSLSQNGIKIVLYIFLGIWGGILGLILAQLINSFISLIMNVLVWKLSNKSQ